MESFSSFSLILASGFALLYFAHSEATRKVPQSVPWAGLRNEVLAKTRANVREITAGLRTLRTGYHQVSEKPPAIITLLTTSIYSSVKRVSHGLLQILDFVPLLWCLKNT